MALQKYSNNTHTTQLIRPFLKWAGGKSQLLPAIKKRLPLEFSTYYEPFLGGGAVFFYLQPSKAVVSDSNEELINVYRVIRDDIEELINDLKQHVNSKEYFYKMRELDRDKDKYAELSPVKRASRIIYLNKTCYNGLFRVNKSGEFNAPFGNYKKPQIVNEPVLRAISSYLNNAELVIKCGDFEECLKNAQEGDFAYLDPPYFPLSNTANFTGYDKSGFDENCQVRLKKVCDELDERGVKFLLSNSKVDFIQSLYGRYIREIITAKRAINSRGDKRGEIEELLIRNYELSDSS